MQPVAPVIFSNKPPYTERYVWWCEGTGSQIMATFPLDSTHIIKRGANFPKVGNPHELSFLTINKYKLLFRSSRGDGRTNTRIPLAEIMNTN